MENKQTEGIVTRRLPPGRTPFMPIVTSPYREDIDRMIFYEHMPVMQVYRYLKDTCGITDISYSMLDRYKKQTQAKATPAEIVQTSQEEMRRSWRVLAKIVERGEEILERGATPSVKDVMTAIKSQNDMLAKLGVGVSMEQVEVAKRMLRRLVEEIILPEVTDEQRQRILQRILDDEELAQWVLDEEGAE